MSKKTIAFIVLACIVVAGLVYFAISMSQSDEPESAANVPTPSVATSQGTQQDQENQEIQIDENDTMPTESGTYTEYSAEAVSSANGRRILFFHAPWCPQCRSLEKSIQSGSIPSDVTIFKVDYDTNQKLRQKYGVTLQTTVVLLDENEEEAKKFVPYDNPSLQAVKENLL